MKYDYYWSRQVGDFVDSKTGKKIADSSSFDGSIRDWYETLISLIAEIVNEEFIHKLSLDWEDTPSILVNEDACILLQVSRGWHSVSQISFSKVSFEHGPAIGYLLGKYRVYPIIEDDTIIIIQNSTTRKVLKLLGFKEE